MRAATNSSGTICGEETGGGDGAKVNPQELAQPHSSWRFFFIKCSHHVARFFARLCACL